MVSSSGPIAANTSRDLVVRFDATGLDGIAGFALNPNWGAGWGSSCTTTGQVSTCTFNVRPWPGETTFTQNFNPTLTAIVGAPQGQAGHLKISQGWAGSPVGPATDVAVYAGGPKLELDPNLDSQPYDTQPGAVIGQPLQVTNNGTVASGRQVVAAQLSPGLSFTQHFANCSYGTYTGTTEPFKSAEAAICTVNTSVQPGQTVTVDPIQALVGSDALYSDISYTLSSDDDYALRFVRGSYAFPPASQTGPRLTAGLPEDDNAQSGPPTLGQARDYAVVQYRVDNHADFSAHGAWAPTDGGTKGTLSVKVHNGGPASVEYLRSGNPIGGVLVTLPAGVTISGKLPADCGKVNPGLVHCYLPTFLLNGADRTFDLPLAVADPAAAPAVTIGVTTEQGLYENAVQPLPYDDVDANNTTSLALGLSATQS
ncbi:hypothetical protein [Kitasatospora sp. NPDC048407]|uniref:hypothetical protein n=1 Tax=Kitasatospora sp. NPDC048407 TaxID=3364051 RepID=UPI00371063D4